jgi:hypothetical protein
VLTCLLGAPLEGLVGEPQHRERQHGTDERGEERCDERHHHEVDEPGGHRDAASTTDPGEAVGRAQRRDAPDRVAGRYPEQRADRGRPAARRR